MELRHWLVPGNVKNRLNWLKEKSFIDTGRDPFDQNFRKFRYKIKWNRTFLEIRFEICGQPLEVVLKFRENRTGNFG